MPQKKRHSIISLGDISAGAYTAEVDASAFDYAIVMVKNAGGGASTITVEASPQAFGTTATWYTYGRTNSVPASTNEAWSIPQYPYSEFTTANRIRIKSSAATTIWVELVREIG